VPTARYGGVGTCSLILREVAHASNPDKNPKKNFEQANINKLWNFIQI
jgi:hypothetical protein